MFDAKENIRVEDFQRSPTLKLMRNANKTTGNCHSGGRVCQFTKLTYLSCMAQRKWEDVCVQQNGTQKNWVRKIGGTKSECKNPEREKKTTVCET